MREKLDADWIAVKERMMNDDAPEEIRAALTTAYLTQKQSLGGRKRGPTISTSSRRTGLTGM